MFNLSGVDYTRTEKEIDLREQELYRKSSELMAQRRRLEEESADITRELCGLVLIRKGIKTIVGKPGEAVPHVPGLTEHIRGLLSRTAVPLTPTQIRGSCEAVGIRATSRKNLLIAVHSVLKRLDLDVRRVNVNGKAAYLPRTRPVARLTRSQSLRANR